MDSASAAPMHQSNGTVLWRRADGLVFQQPSVPCFTLPSPPPGYGGHYPPSFYPPAQMYAPPPPSDKSATQKRLEFLERQMQKMAATVTKTGSTTTVDTHGCASPSIDELASLKAQIESLKHENESKESALLEAQTAHAEAASSDAKKTATIASKLLELQAVRRDLDESHKDATSSAKEVRLLKSEFSKVEAVHRDRAKELREVRRDLDKSRKDATSSAKEVQLLKSEFSKIEAVHRDRAKELQEMQQDLDESRKDATFNAKELRLLKSEFSKMEAVYRDRVTQLQAEIAKRETPLKKEKSNCQGQLVQLKKTNKVLTKKVKEMEKDYLKQSQAMATLEIKLTESQKMTRVTAAEALRDKTPKDVRELEIHIRTLKTQLAQMHSDPRFALRPAGTPNEAVVVSNILRNVNLAQMIYLASPDTQEPELIRDIAAKLVSERSVSSHVVDVSQTMLAFESLARFGCFNMTVPRMHRVEMSWAVVQALMQKSTPDGVPPTADDLAFMNNVVKRVAPLLIDPLSKKPMTLETLQRMEVCINKATGLLEMRERVADEGTDTDTEFDGDGDGDDEEYTTITAMMRDALNHPEPEMPPAPADVSDVDKLSAQDTSIATAQHLMDLINVAASVKPPPDSADVLYATSIGIHDSVMRHVLSSAEISDAARDKIEFHNEVLSMLVTFIYASVEQSASICNLGMVTLCCLLTSAHFMDKDGTKRISDTKKLAHVVAVALIGTSELLPDLVPMEDSKASILLAASEDRTKKALWISGVTHDAVGVAMGIVARLRHASVHLNVSMPSAMKLKKANVDFMNSFIWPCFQRRVKKELQQETDRGAPIDIDYSGRHPFLMDPDVFKCMDVRIKSDDGVTAECNFKLYNNIDALQRATRDADLYTLSIDAETMLDRFKRSKPKSTPTHDLKEYMKKKREMRRAGVRIHLENTEKHDARHAMDALHLTHKVINRSASHALNAMGSIALRKTGAEEHDECIA